MKIVMFDQDGVVCDRNYKTTKDIRATITTAINHGITFVPNSDTPERRLTANTRLMLKLNPEFVIAERGAVVRIHNDIIRTADIIGIGKYTQQLGDVFRGNNKEVAIGDSATWIRTGHLFKPLSQYVIIDALRSQSIGFYLLVTDARGLPQIDEDWCDEGMTIANMIALPRGLGNLGLHLKYGVAIANNPSVTKTTGYRFVRNFLSPNNSYHMIGDADMDIINDRNVRHFAVSNASLGLKHRAEFVSGFSHTAGLEECIQKIITLPSK